MRGGFCNIIGRPHFPVELSRAAQFACVCRGPGAYKAYIAHIRSARELLGLPVDWADAPLLARVKLGVEKSALVFKGPRLFVSAALIIRISSVHGNWAPERFFCVLSWVFMLRARSEASKLTFTTDLRLLNSLSDPLPDGMKGVIGLAGNFLIIRPRSRKTHIFGDVIRRSCVCAAKSGVSIYIPSELCPVHVLHRWLVRNCAPGERVFASTLADAALGWFRVALEAREVLDSSKYGFHSLRRGSAQELVKCGGDLATLLRAGGWRSGAFRSYLDMVGLENSVISASAQALVDLDAEVGD